MGKKHYIIPIFVPHEGCPHNCVFCNQSRITGEVIREEKAKEHINVDAKYTRSIIEDYLKTIDSKDSTIEVSFFGGTFTAIPIEKQRELLTVAKEYKDLGMIDYIRMSTRPDYINKDILNHLKSFNADIIELGVQSLDEEVLKCSGRGHSAEDVRMASKLIKEYGFILGHQIMPGLPGDNFKKDIDTAKKSISMKPDICRIYPSLVIKDTPMEVMFKRGEYIPYTLDEAVSISRDIYAMYIANDINVIRIGLQPTENINLHEDVIAGPFHPSIRELVESSLINDILKKEICKTNCDHIEIQVNPKDVSKLYADKKKYFSCMVESINGIKASVCINKDLNRDEYILRSKKNINKIIIKDYIKKML